MSLPTACRTKCSEDRGSMSRAERLGRSGEKEVLRKNIVSKRVYVKLIGEGVHCKPVSKN